MKEVKVTMKRTKQLQLSSFFNAPSSEKNKKDSMPPPPPSRPLKRTKTEPKSPIQIIIDPLAEQLGVILQKKPQYIGSLNSNRNKYGTTHCSSWILHIPNWAPPASKADFKREWNMHPPGRKQLKIFGRWVEERRWSQAWGTSINYSGMVNPGREIQKNSWIDQLMERANQLIKQSTTTSTTKITATTGTYNACLQNWYTPDDTMGLHSDDEDYLYPEYPIFSVSWGGPRRFLLSPKDKATAKNKTVEVWLKEGDLLIMGGACQLTHKHQVPKSRVTKDPPTWNRINWTIRAVKNP